MEEFENEDLAKAAKISSDMQGLYIYREERLIHDADWLDMFQKEPHGTLLRVEFSFDHRLDDAFQLNIKKSQVVLDDELWRWLKDQFLTAPRREADRRYRQGQKKKNTEKAKGVHDASNRSIVTKEADAGSGAKVDIKDAKTGEVKVTNRQGEFNLKLKIGSASKPGEVCVQSANDVDDGLLFEPAIIDKHKAVRVNTQHPYYHKVYVPNFNHSVTVQGMDSLLWALCVAELSTTTDKTADALKDMRYEVTRILRKLVEDLPEPDIETMSMKFDPQLVGSRLSEQIGLHFKVSSGVDAEGQDWCLLRPTDLPSDLSEDHAFGLRITLGWRRVHISFEPGQFAGKLLSDMAKADRAGRIAFQSILQECAQLGADINFEVNDETHALDDDSVWEKNWSRVSLHLNKGQLELGIEEGRPDIEIVSQWAGYFASAIMSILPVEREIWTSQEDLGGYPEGAISTLQVNRYERDQRNRDAALLIHGAVCRVCGLDFESRYGKVAAGFIEIHHTTPVSQLGPDYHIDPAKDLVPLCPNCHAVAHRRNPPYSVDEIRQMLCSDKQSS